MIACITTSRRINLFRQMIRSFLNNCIDINLITEFYIFDDRSSDNEIQEMKTLLPTALIHKNKIAGQQYSILQAWELCKNEQWYINLEDDWLFTNKFSIQELLNIANDNKKIRNVTLRGFEGITIHSNGLKYRLHTYHELPTLVNPQRWDLIKMTDCAWYGFSLNPSIIHIPTVYEIGFKHTQNNPNSRGWDKEFAIEYLRRGYKRANIFEGCIEHIGQDKSFYNTNL